MAFGLIDTQYIDFAEGQSESRLRNLTNRLGINVTEFIARVDGAMAAINANTDPLVEALVYRTSEDSVTGDFTAAKKWQRGGEYTAVRPQRGEGSGWYLPLYFNWIGLGFTERALKTITLSKFEGELRTTIEGIVKGRRADVLDRLTSVDVWPLDDDGAGQTPGFAGSGTGGLAYVGKLPPGVSAGTFNLYERTTSANFQATLDKFVDWLTWFHGTIELLATPDTIQTIKGLTGFTPAGSPLIRPAAGVAEALVDTNTYVGVYRDNVLVRKADEQLSGPNVTLFKSYGANNVRNPLAWRWSEIWDQNAFVEDKELFPLALAQINQWYGLGVNNRVGAANISIGASGAYTPPAIDR